MYIKGSSNFADHLSRLPQRKTVSESNEYDYVNFIRSDNRLNLNFKDISRTTKTRPDFIQTHSGNTRARTMYHIGAESTSCPWITIAFYGFIK